MPTRMGVRDPIRPTNRPASGEHTVTPTLNGRMSSPAAAAPKSRTFWKYWVTTSSIPYTEKKATKMVTMARR